MSRGTLENTPHVRVLEFKNESKLGARETTATSFLCLMGCVAIQTTKLKEKRRERHVTLRDQAHPLDSPGELRSQGETTTTSGSFTFQTSRPLAMEAGAKRALTIHPQPPDPLHW